MSSRVQTCYHRIQHELRIRWTTLWFMAFAFGLFLAAFIYSVLLDARAPAVWLTRFSLASALIVFVGCCLGLGWAIRRQRTGRLTRINMRSLFPQQRRELDTWLSTELTGPCAEAARVVSERRLEETFPARPRIRLVAGRTSGRLLSICIGLLTLVGLGWRWGTPTEWLSAYLQRVIFFQRPVPVTIESIEPAVTWVDRNRPFDLAVTFDRRPAGNSSLEIMGSSPGTFEIPAAAESRWQAPPQSHAFTARIRANRNTIDERIPFRVYPENPLTIEWIGVRNPEGELIRTVSKLSRRLTVSAGNVLVVGMARADCPMKSFGFGGRRRGDVTLTKTRRPDRFEARVRITEDEWFNLYWQYPDREVRMSAPLHVECLANDRPAVELFEPEDGKTYPAVPEQWTIRATGRDRDGIHRAFLHATDYHGLHASHGFFVV
ncbi:MAG: hypothetical protein AAF492_03845, partial [Verrucomicrobiota bacterium]